MDAAHRCLSSPPLPPCQVELPTGLSVVPGPASGEGCSLEGGCASCPYMKMNSLQALQTGEQRGYIWGSSR